MLERRLFVGISVPEPDAARLAAYAAACAGSSRTARPTPARNLHATACFIGPVAGERVAPLEAALLEASAGIAPFVMPFTGIKLAPPGRPATMVWATYDGGDAFARLALVLCATSARATPIVLPNRPLAHVTLLRDRSVIREPLPPFEGALKPLAVDACVLYASVTRPEGPVYQALARFPLSGRG
ncbi:MAG TPA: 2'-5' RNA ligase family protein [Candidatus Binatia bacterium]|nr:2'-5' RNA ligase family protein [Candidatus Binatia bacterium]